MLVFIPGKKLISTKALTIPSINTLALQMNAPFLWHPLAASDQNDLRWEEGHPKEEGRPSNCQAQYTEPATPPELMKSMQVLPLLKFRTSSAHTLQDGVKLLEHPSSLNLVKFKSDVVQWLTSFTNNTFLRGQIKGVYIKDWNKQILSNTKRRSTYSEREDKG